MPTREEYQAKVWSFVKKIPLPQRVSSVAVPVVSLKEAKAAALKMPLGELTVSPTIQRAVSPTIQETPVRRQKPRREGRPRLPGVMVSFLVRLPSELKARLNALKKRTGMSLGEMVRSAVSDWIARHEEKAGLWQ